MSILTHSFNSFLTCARSFSFDAAHRVLGHSNRCRFLHGHTYKVEVTCRSQKLDDLGMVIDFGVIKEKVGKFLDETFDHNILLHMDDPLAKQYTDRIEGNLTLKQVDAIFGDRVPVLWPFNPTAENIAKVIYNTCKGLLQDEAIEVFNVRVYETPNCWADYTEAIYTCG